MKIDFANLYLRPARIHWLITGKGAELQMPISFLDFYLPLFSLFQLAAITKLKAKGQILSKTDPNSIKKKQNDPQDVLEVKKRIEKNTTLSPQGTADFKVHSRKEKLFIKEMFKPQPASLISGHNFTSLHFRVQSPNRISTMGTVCFL